MSTMISELNTYSRHIIDTLRSKSVNIFPIIHTLSGQPTKLQIFWSFEGRLAGVEDLFKDAEAASRLWQDADSGVTLLISSSWIKPIERSSMGENEIRLDDMNLTDLTNTCAITPLSAVCAALIKEVGLQQNTAIVFFCGLYRNRREMPPGEITKMMIRSFIHQMIHRNRPLSNRGYFTVDDLEEVQLNGGFAGNVGTEDIGILWTLFRKVVESHPSQRKIVCVIDGLGLDNDGLSTYSQEVIVVVKTLVGMGEWSKHVRGRNEMSSFRLICTGPSFNDIVKDHFSGSSVQMLELDGPYRLS
ncbi:hypothetical protein CSIM01_03641 [Colletotrichum simmondsii]|uniref:Uncharacterized protein n=1 Tax=Colletotrichum simmondsii TaxID=703756 RepID=A0A135RRD0_9PEZI|nr:hypothetical protein CSIM01_03641 [Colletotrichum simmondsii]